MRTLLPGYERLQLRQKQVLYHLRQAAQPVITSYCTVEQNYQKRCKRQNMDDRLHWARLSRMACVRKTSYN